MGYIAHEIGRALLASLRTPRTPRYFSVSECGAVRRPRTGRGEWSPRRHLRGKGPLPGDSVRKPRQGDRTRGRGFEDGRGRCGAGAGDSIPSRECRPN